MSDKRTLNVSRREVRDHVRRSIRLGLPQFKRDHPKPDAKVVLAAGGPSLKTHFDELKRLYDAGAKVWAMNGTHDFLIERGVIPECYVLMDGRKWNARFVGNWRSDIAYVICSQCHPEVFRTLEGAHVWIWHSLTAHRDAEDLLKDYYLGRYDVVGSGRTVGLNAIWLARKYGYLTQMLYGYDGCFMDGEHHAYEQPENDKDRYTIAGLRGRKFRCAGWMLGQYEDFQQLFDKQGLELDVDMHIAGDGLLKHYLEERYSDANDTPQRTHRGRRRAGFRRAPKVADTQHRGGAGAHQAASRRGAQEPEGEPLAGAD